MFVRRNLLSPHLNIIRIESHHLPALASLLCAQKRVAGAALNRSIAEPDTRTPGIPVLTVTTDPHPHPRLPAPANRILFPGGTLG